MMRSSFMARVRKEGQGERSKYIACIREPLYIICEGDLSEKVPVTKLAH
ncbi:MAG: hypothetical protein KME50_00050 [Nostoc desertorum CM1-VF14]|nr:hypothetical protein [Nostoc desertorum CM1-VF14]